MANTYKYEVTEIHTNSIRIKNAILNDYGKKNWELVSYVKKWKLFGPSIIEVVFKKTN